MNPTEKLADFIARTDISELSEEVTDRALQPIVDTLACIGAGLVSEPGTILFDHLELDPQLGIAELFGAKPVSLMEAQRALLLGTLGAAIDYDDVSSNGHPSAILVATILALNAEMPLDGSRFIDAYLIGYEISARVGDMFHLPHSRHGWHTTSTAGTFGATAVACRLLGLDTNATRHALGIAASMSAGIGLNFGTVTKPLHSGLAARNGIEAARLAASGVTAADEVFAGHRGFVEMYGLGQGDISLVESLGNPWALIERPATLKKYPSCFTTHRAIDASLKIKQKYQLSAEQIRQITVRAPTKSTASLVYDRPRTGLEGKFSAQYVTVAALLDGNINMDSFTDDAVRRDEIRALLEKIDVAEDPRCRPEDPQALSSTPIVGGFWEVNLTTHSGQTYQEVSTEAPGLPNRLLTWDEIGTKFSDCLSSANYENDQTQRLFLQLRDLPRCVDVRMIFGDLHRRVTTKLVTARN